MSVAPTLVPEAAARRLWDVAVVGAGPAGAMAARELARRGAGVLLIDKARFPRYKVCGGCLNPRAVRVLGKAGLGDLVGRLGAVPLTRLRLAARGAFADISLPPGAGVSREGLDTALVGEAVKAGAAFLPGTTATLLAATGTGDRRGLRLRQGRQEHGIEAKVVLAANGLASRLDEHAHEPEEAAVARPWEPDSRVGAGVMIERPAPGYEPRTIYMACAAEGYVGQTVVEDGRVDMAAALDPAAVKRAGGVGELAEAILERAGFPSYSGLASLPWKGTPHLTRQAPTLGGDRLFVLGDAAGYIEPFTGEGMAWAFAGASLVAPLALKAVTRGWDPELLVRWRGAYHRKVTRRQIICRITADLLRRPVGTGVMVRVMSVAPWLARPLFRIMYRD
ncbi:MAG: FAD-dependent oxidoreductase [Zavarzinella sp.]|nr:FAD-dependent oxidoreductase [Zavarzinella sp.]